MEYGSRIHSYLIERSICELNFHVRKHYHIFSFLLYILIVKIAILIKLLLEVWTDCQKQNNGRLAAYYK